MHLIISNEKLAEIENKTLRKIPQSSPVGTSLTTVEMESLQMAPLIERISHSRIAIRVMSKENEMQQCEAILASEIFSQSLLGQVNHHDVDCMIEAQKHMLQRYEKTNEMLINCNALSATRLSTASHDFKRHTLLLLDMKKDLEIVFKRIKNLKTRLGMQYPQAFESCKDECSMAEEDAEMEFGKESETVSKTNTSVNVDKPTSKIVSNLVTNNSSSCSQTTTPSSEASNTSSDST